MWNKIVIQVTSVNGKWEVITSTKQYYINNDNTYKNTMRLINSVNRVLDEFLNIW